MALEGEGGQGGEGGGFGGAVDLLGGAAGGGGDEGQGGEGGGGEGGGSGEQEIQGGADPDWYGSLSADVGEGEQASNRDWIKAKGFKDLDGVTKALRSAERALHDSGKVKVPGEGAKPEEIAAYRKAIGVPDDVAGYALPKLQDAAGNDVPLDQGLLGKLLPKALEHGVPAAAMNGLVEDFVKLQLDAVAQEDSDQQKGANDWLGKQGENGKARMAAIDAAGRALGLSGTEMKAIRNALEPGKAMEIFAKLGEGMAEDVMLTGGKGRFGVTGREAQGELDAMKTKAGTDKAFATAVNTPGSPENARWNRLQQQAADWEEHQRRMNA